MKEFMMISQKNLEYIKNKYGSTFYVLDVQQFEKNYDELLSAFTNIYPNCHISYSYKTNYIPRLCKSILSKGGYAEIVSDMEYQIAQRIGVPKNMVIFNGPYKDKTAIEDIVLHNGIVNLDSLYDFSIVKNLSKRIDKKIKLGIRVNLDIGDGVISRFGFDPFSEEFKAVLKYLVNEETNIELNGIHLHCATRDIRYWPNRAIKLLELIDFYNLHLEYFSLGGGIFGKMDDSLKEQFSTSIPTYDEYANAVCPILKEYFDKKGYFPKLFIEPGSALVGDCMKFIAPVVSIKNIRGNQIATLLGSIYNINPTLNTKNPPIEVIHLDNNKNIACEVKDLNFGGFTCIENDYLYRGYNGKLAVDDLIVFGNVGSYSVVLKPPFILPNFPIISIYENKVELVKRKEMFGDLFQTYVF